MEKDYIEHLPGWYAGRVRRAYIARPLLSLGL